MAVAGRKPKPYIQAVREGTFRADRHKQGVRFAPSEAVEPDWEDVLPGDDEDAVYARETAAELWGRLVPALTFSAGLVDVQREPVIDLCVTWATIKMGVRILNREGHVVQGAHGKVRHPWNTIVAQHRQHYRSLIGEFGLTPASATRITAPEPDDEDDDIWD
ncbi:P27 family phage terminase small subunit [Streptomyces sp. PSKA30]|uniref:P27 family phage terminase small subunit n=1 Tax=Streptomyces sp. PSKA30 TaxID=2874597 RepID=UPI001CD083A5|nr:P27 family phage terminase small subunit [Streptomyces sp. PSKA30]MBZ9638012.1 P27 family phage terminase small subunit [Streptomyces sp. PSKA30]